MKTEERLIYEILSVVAEIPEGCVTSYGQIARLIGRDRNARLVGKVLSMAGFTMGRVMRQMMRGRLVLRIVAASSRLASMFRRMPPIRI